MSIIIGIIMAVWAVTLFLRGLLTSAMAVAVLAFAIALMVAV